MTQKIHLLLLLACCIWVGAKAPAQILLSKTAISNGGQPVAGNTYKTQVTVGQSLAGISRTIQSEATVGFWYLPRFSSSRFKFAKNPTAIPGRIPTGENGGIYELQRHTHAEKINALKIYPNPVVSQASVEFQLAGDGNVHLALYDFKGNRMFTLLRGKLEAGRYKIEFQSDQLPAAVYSVVLTSEQIRLQEKCMVMN